MEFPSILISSQIELPKTNNEVLVKIYNFSMNEKEKKIFNFLDFFLLYIHFCLNQGRLESTPLWPLLYKKNIEKK